MAVGAVVIVQRKNGKQVDIFHIVRFFPHAGHKGLIVIGQSAALRGQKIVLVRDDGEINIHILPGKIIVVQIAKALRRVVQHLFVHGVIQLGEMALGKVQAVVVQLAQKVSFRQGFQTAKTVPAGKLILSIGLKILREVPGQNAFGTQRGHGGQLPAFTEGKFPVRHEQAAQEACQQRPRCQQDKQYIFCLL